MGNIIFLYLASVNIALTGINIIKLMDENKKVKVKLEKNKDVFKREIKIKSYKPIYMLLSKKEKELLMDVTKNLEDKDIDLYNFYQTIHKKTKIENIRFFINNVQTLKIEKKDGLIIRKVNGIYSPKKNKITLFTEKRKVLYHELLHMSSTPNNENEDRTICGFHKIYYKNNEIKGEIGVGINEGYTELQNNRLFKDKNYTYLKLQKIASLIELFYEEKKDMENSYYNAKLEGIIYQLNKYMSYVEIIDLLIDIDEIYYNNFNIIKYLKLKKKLFKFYSASKDQDEIRKFKKELNRNQIIKIMTKNNIK